MPVTSTSKPFYNIILEKRSGDKILKAQTTDPRGYVDMEWPSAAELNIFDDEIQWEISNENILIYAIELRPLTFNSLISEDDFNKMRRL